MIINRDSVDTKVLKLLFTNVFRIFPYQIISR
jgi:hypothetical protein